MRTLAIAAILTTGCGGGNTSRGLVDAQGMPDGRDGAQPHDYTAINISGDASGHVLSFPDDYAPTLPGDFELGVDYWRWADGEAWPDAFRLGYARGGLRGDPADMGDWERVRRVVFGEGLVSAPSPGGSDAWEIRGSASGDALGYLFRTGAGSQTWYVLDPEVDAQGRLLGSQYWLVRLEGDPGNGNFRQANAPSVP
ncbi:MAG: hypothetical protein KTR31_10430 [Myxococcales bacterium]|nr:hypothetical protein [Myxococcales bacterium]